MAGECTSRNRITLVARSAAASAAVRYRAEGDALGTAGRVPALRLQVRSRKACLEFLQQRPQRVHCQMAGMHGGLGQAAYFPHYVPPVELPRFFNRPAFDQFSDGRAASHGRHAPFRAKADVGDSLAIELQREFQNVSAGGILQLRGGIGSFDVAGVSWILKVIQGFGRVHNAIVMPYPEEFPPLQCDDAGFAHSPPHRLPAAERNRDQASS